MLNSRPQSDNPHERPNNPSPTDPKVFRTLIHKGRKFNFEFCRVLEGNGSQDREVVRHPGAVVLLPILGSGLEAKVLLIRNWRIALETWSLELPAGTMEPPELPVSCAARELVEETGYKAATLIPLTRFHTSPGLSDESMWAFVATDLTHVGQDLEDDERIEVVPVSVSECLRLIASGELCDAKSMVTILLALRQGMLGIV